ncbi:MAG: CHAD domain-containing protein [Vicinamibacterales bacterium]
MARPSPIEALVAPRVRALLEVLPNAVAGQTEPVHRARVASRRLRELLPPLRAAVAAGAADRARAEVRRVTRALGPVRELDVALALFDELATAHGLRAGARQVVVRAMTRDRDAALRRAQRALPERRQVKLAAALAALDGPMPAVALDGVQAAVDDRVARRVARVRKALHRAGAMYVPERLHQIRIAVKQLRYALEVAATVRRSRAAARIAQLRDVQDLLGRAHDLHVLAERIRRVQTGVVRTSRATAAELERLLTRIDIACRAEHAAFMSRRAALLALCDAVQPLGAAPDRRQSVA